MRKKRSLNIRTHIFMPEETETLKRYRDGQKDYRLKLRFIALLLIAGNTGTEIVAAAVGKDIRTVETWYGKYLTHGPDALNSFQYQPKRCFLSDDQLADMIAWVKKELPSDTKVICHYIREQTGIAYCQSAVAKLLKKNGLRRLRPKLIPGKPPSEKKQTDFIEKYEKLRKSAADPESGRVVIFCDAMHFVHQTVPATCWGDPSERPVLKANSGRQRLNIMGGYDPVTCKLIHETDEKNCDSEKAIIFFKKLLRTYPKASMIKVFADNATYFHARNTQEWLEKNPRISLYFLPAYAPNLNLIERLWRFAKGKLIRNTYYEKYKTFRCHVFRLLNNIHNYESELSSLMVEKFQIIRQ
ncbi:IS630 family transposase [Desulfonema ishimotonii]|uniref:IS630 family transposase n=1 Tax=Desulfonema ishimotonii TaxID=45657 RepID=A0A401FXR0_9BACT|nr:IS630 family transposase [Desulfonema ishimotonii]GBC61736.1 IS630 family transposase [Desulfonema ishimotonii]